MLVNWRQKLGRAVVLAPVASLAIVWPSATGEPIATAGVTQAGAAVVQAEGATGATQAGGVVAQGEGKTELTQVGAVVAQGQGRTYVTQTAAIIFFRPSSTPPAASEHELRCLHGTYLRSIRMVGRVEQPRCVCGSYKPTVPAVGRASAQSTVRGSYKRSMPNMKGTL